MTRFVLVVAIFLLPFAVPIAICWEILLSLNLVVLLQIRENNIGLLPHQTPKQTRQMLIVNHIVAHRSKCNNRDKDYLYYFLIV